MGAIAPKMGENHTACFETLERVGAKGGTILTFQLTQKFQSAEHAIGRFRIAVTNSRGPTLLNGIPKHVVPLLAIAPAKRDTKQRTAVLDYFRGIDGKISRLQRTLADARKPKPADPELKALRDRLAEARRALSVDPVLAQFRQDIELSARQLKAHRLTAAQDLTWALINSSAFLFNH